MENGVGGVILAKFCLTRAREGVVSQDFGQKKCPDFTYRGVGSVIVRVAAVEFCAGRAMKKHRQTGWKLARRRKVWTPPTASLGVRAVGTVLEYGKGGTRYCGAKAVFDVASEETVGLGARDFPDSRGVKERLCLRFWGLRKLLP